LELFGLHFANAKTCHFWPFLQKLNWQNSETQAARREERRQKEAKAIRKSQPESCHTG
jgi:hypothetical protein